VDSVVALQLENKGALWGSMVKETMKRKKPSFNETYYGFRSFSSLLEDAQRRGVVTLRRDQKSGSYIVEDLGAAARGDGSIVPPRASEVDAVMASVPVTPSASSSGDQGPGGPSSSAPANGQGGSGRGESRGEREPREPRERRPAASAAAAPVVAASTVSPTTTGDDIATSPEVETPDGEAPTRPRRRRGGRGRGRGREGAEREARPDLEARGEEPLPLDEDSNPSIPTPPQAAAAYAEVVERMTKTDAPVFWEVPSLTAPALKTPAAADLSVIALPATTHRHEAVTPPEPAEASPVRAAEMSPSESPVTAPKAPTPPKPTPPVAPVDPSKASFSLLGWLKGGG